jgi:hypothetical protein
MVCVQDVDIIVLNWPEPTNIERLKARITSRNNRFFVTHTRNPWTILWYGLSPTSPRSVHRCKVDVLVPGLLDIPQIPLGRIVHTTDVPGVRMMPLLVVILLKLRGWNDHRNDKYLDKRQKALVDVRDIDQLLNIAVGKRCWLGDEEWVPGELREKAAVWLRSYVLMYPGTKERWEKIGLMRAVRPPCVLA